MKTMFIFSVKANREESNLHTKELKEEVIARLEKTREDIALVEGKTVTSIGEVYENIHTTEERHSASITDLSQSLEVGGFQRKKLFLNSFFRAWNRRLRRDLKKKFSCCYQRH